MWLLSHRRGSPAAVISMVIFLTAFCAAQTSPSSSSDHPDLTQLSVEDLMKIKVDTVYGASKHLQKVTQAAASVTIVTAEEIHSFGYRTLADVLRSVPGFYVTYDRNYSYAAVRGFGRTGDYNERILLLVDGHRMNDDIYDLAYIGAEFPLDIDLVDRIEVIHGPSAAIYGNNAFFAVVNVITRSGRQSKGLQIAGSTGSYGTNFGRFTFGDKGKNWEALVSTTLYDSHGPSKLFFPEFNSPDTNLGVARNLDSQRYRQVFAKAAYKDFSFELVYGPREKKIPTASFGTAFNNPNAQTTDRTGYADLGFSHRFGSDWDLEAHLFYDIYTYDGLYPFNYSAEPGGQITLNHDYLNGAWWGEEVKLSKHVFSRHLLTVGSEFRDNARQTQTNFDIEPFALYLDNHHSSQTWAFYAQDEYSIINKKLLLNLGIRRDQDYAYGGATSPRAGLIYDPFAHTTIKFLYGTAFRAPNAYERYYNGIGQIPNGNLQPERIQTAEVVVEQYAGDRFHFSASIFHNRIHDLIEQVATPEGLQFKNQDSVRAKGAELAAERKWKSGVSLQMNYSYASAFDPNEHVSLKDTPAHMANVAVILPVVPQKLSAGLDLHFVGSTGTLSGKKTDPFVVTNVTLFTRRLYRQFEVSGSIYNLFNQRYGYPGGNEHVEDVIYQDGRNARLKIAYTWGTEKVFTH